MSQKVSLQTADSVQIIGLYVSSGGTHIAILLHMMPATKESWEGIARELLARGYASLAIDLRGHGESTMGQTLNYKRFHPAQHQAKRLDVEAVLAFAREQGYDEAHTILMGASIGANLSIRATAEHVRIPLTVALSPGLDYHGVTTRDAIKVISPDQKVILVASDDDEESWDAVHELHRLNPLTVLIERSNLGHGTTMTDKDPGLVHEIFTYLP